MDIRIDPVCGRKEEGGFRYIGRTKICPQMRRAFFLLSVVGYFVSCFALELVTQPPNRVTKPTPVCTVQDQVTLSQQERSQFSSIPRRSGFVPNASFVAGEDLGAKLTNQHEAPSERRTRGWAQGRENRSLGCEDPGTARREVMVQGVMPSASRANRNSGSRNRTPTEKRPASGSDPARSDQSSSNPVGGEQFNDDHASGDQAGTSGGGFWNEDTLPADGEWAEQIREKDELISTLKRQLTALGEQPMEEVISLEVPIRSLS